MTGWSAEGRVTRFGPTRIARAFGCSACAATRRAACRGADVSSCVGHRRIVSVDETPRSRPTMPQRRTAAIRFTRAPRAILHFRRRYCSPSIDAGNEAGDHEIRPPFRIEFDWNWFWIE
ncbi:hypothetical protein A8H35_17770 [Burkholderia thailandensis]|nr:hypothetical protein WJ27_07715 [Burkholderia thailandensis]AVR10448.1 hypothetical protein A8H31_24735 [Burkholderia thailandensis]AWY59942.1 hypothetical protein A8H35_17770 [Burkholderia thailandensis]AWY68951.1 hypothetical protein A8H36_29495 [Burkholderia thailandensis]KVG14142.1 hypothetical protein WJ25_02715 [Burkholderia thailandensis]